MLSLLYSKEPHYLPNISHELFKSNAELSAALDFSILYLLPVQNAISEEFQGT